MRRFPVSFLVSIVLLAGLRAAPLPAVRHAFVLIAHRGDHTRALENTLAAITNSIAAGADFTEFDVRRSRDGHYLLMHDSTVDRTSDGHGAVRDLDWAALRALRLRDRAHPERGTDTIPSLEEALAACKGRIHVYLDFKAGEPRDVAAIVRAAGMTNQVIVYVGPSGVARWREVAPELPVISSPPDAALRGAEALGRWLDAAKVEAIDGCGEGQPPALVAAARARGVRVWPDIQGAHERPEFWKQAVSRGIDGAQSDKPAEFRAWLEANPAETARRP